MVNPALPQAKRWEMELLPLMWKDIQVTIRW
jgi:hypothetical protein